MIFGKKRAADDHDQGDVEGRVARARAVRPKPPHVPRQYERTTGTGEERFVKRGGEQFHQRKYAIVTMETRPGGRGGSNDVVVGRREEWIDTPVVEE